MKPQIFGIITSSDTPPDNRLDGIEVRADLTEAKLFPNIPTLLTLRTKQSGGSFSGSEAEYCEQVTSLAAMKPEYLDIESHAPPELFSKIKEIYPDTKIICSYHNTQKTPEDLEGLWKELKKHPADLYKIVPTAKNSLDAMRLLEFLKGKEKLIVFCMGEDGSFSRILSPILGSPIVYTPLGESCASGQIGLEELINTYNIKNIDRETDILGLIGNPVNKSLSRFIHPEAIRELNLNAVYVRIRIEEKELQPFLKLAANIGFRGLSVTMPLKELTAQFIQAKHPAINTLKFTEVKIEGINTDGVGALNAIKQSTSIQGQHIVILGAGGAAIGIATEALNQGAKVTLINRTALRAEKAAQALGCSWESLEQFSAVSKKGYDILINTIPGPDTPLSAQEILPERVCHEIITTPLETAFTKMCESRNCKIIPGFHMFLEQAKGQYQLWYPKTVSEKSLATAFSPDRYSNREFLWNR